MGNLKFKGKDMNCSVQEMKVHLLNQGFRSWYDINGSTSVKGVFAGIDDTKIVITPKSRSSQIRSILVQFPECYSWDDLENEYYKVKDSLSRKYGSLVTIEDEIYDYQSHYINGRSCISLRMTDSQLVLLYANDVPEDDFDSFDEDDL